MIDIPVSWGEVVDKITILEIKSERIDDLRKLVNIRRELYLLAGKMGTLTPSLEELKGRLKGINEQLWDIEDEIRDCERQKDFGPRFIELARAVYITNDQRSEVKREVNLALNSDLIEEKSYKPYA